MGSYLSRKETFLAEKTITKKGMTEADSFWEFSLKIKHLFLKKCKNLTLE